MTRPVILCIVCLFGGLVGSAAQAQEQPITPDAFLDRVEGQTATFVLPPTDALVGVERFINRKLSVWTRSNGTCAIGTISQRGAKVCFSYDDNPEQDYCWLPFLLDGDLHVRSTLVGEVQRVQSMEKRRLDCVGEPTS